MKNLDFDGNLITYAPLSYKLSVPCIPYINVVFLCNPNYENIFSQVNKLLFINLTNTHEKVTITFSFFLPF